MSQIAHRALQVVLTWQLPAVGKLAPGVPPRSKDTGRGALAWLKSALPGLPLLRPPLLRREAALPGAWNRLGGVAVVNGPLGDAAWLDVKLPAPGLQDRTMTISPNRDASRHTRVRILRHVHQHHGQQQLAATWRRCQVRRGCHEMRRWAAHGAAPRPAGSPAAALAPGLWA